MADGTKKVNAQEAREALDALVRYQSTIQSGTPSEHQARTANLKRLEKVADLVVATLTGEGEGD